MNSMPHAGRVSRESTFSRSIACHRSASRRNEMQSLRRSYVMELVMELQTLSNVVQLCLANRMEIACYQ